MKKFIITSKDEGQRLDKFMQRVMPKVKSGEIFKALRKKKVRVNGKHCDGSYRICKDDEICMYINDEFFEGDEKTYSWQKASSDIQIVYEDNNIIVADKPSGMPSQDIDGVTDSMESRIRAYLYKKGEIDLCALPLFIPSLCHRIDRNTEGLLICAKNMPAQRIINEKIKNREIRKFYLCETEKAPKIEQGRIFGWLYKDEKTRKMIFSDKEIEGASYCETLYKTLKKGEPSLVEAELLTGKTHQIRVGFAHMGTPLLNDVKYGAKKDGGKSYQSLVAYKLVFDFKTDAGQMEYLKGRTIERN